MANSEKKDLGYLGDEFQIRLIHHLMENEDFFRDIIDVVDQNMFTNVNLRTYVMLMKNYYQQTNIKPSYGVMEMYINEKVRSDIDKESAITLNKELPQITSEAVDYIKTLATRFFKQQNIVRVANEILKIAGNGDVDKYDQCADLINQAINVGFNTNLGEKVFNNLDAVLSEKARQPITTGIPQLDEILEGGIGKGELGMIIAPSGVGKTSLTTSLASAAATIGDAKVLQIVFEDRVEQIQRKHIGKITNIESKDLSKNPETISLVKDILSKYEFKDKIEENLRIVRFPTGEVSAQYIENYINKLINSGFKPDLTIIDYFECLKHVADASVKSEWELEGRTMRKLEALASKLNMAIWIPTQGTRDSIGAEYVTMAQAGGSVRKAQIAHIVISIAKSQDDMTNNKATVSVLKNRSGGSGKIWNNVDFNNGTCRIDFSSSEENQDVLAFESKKEQDLKKQIWKNVLKCK